jgi:hypothetical protein
MVDEDNEFVAPLPGTSSISSLVPTPSGKMHVCVTYPLVFTPLQALRDNDIILDVKDTIVLNEEVLKLKP